MTTLLALDIGGTKIGWGIVEAEDSFTVTERGSIPTLAAQGGADVAARICALASELIESHPAITGIAVASAGVVDPATGTIVSATDIMPGWAGTKLGDLLSAHTQLPVRVLNDVHAHGLGEATLGAGRPYRSVLSIAVGTGIGGAFVEDGRVAFGSRGIAGHVGHVHHHFAPDMVCSCGRLGHIESFCSGSGITTWYNSLRPQDKPEVDGGRALQELADSGDPLAQACFARSAYALRAATALPDAFALTQPLSPFALAALELLDPDSPTFALDVVSVIESVLEDPRPLLFAQEKAARAEAVAAMKAQGMEYDERMAALEEVTWPRPLADLLGDAFAVYLHANPWIEDQEISPKSVVREMIENALTFTGIVGRYDVGRSEGIVLRYLTDAYRALRQIVPDELMTDELRSIIAWLSALIRAVDSSLLDEWEAMSTGQALPASDGDGTEGAELAFGAREDGTVPFSANRHAFRTAIRGALFERVEAMSRDNVEALARLDEASRTPVVAPWGEDEWDAVLERYWAEHEWIGIDQRARALSLCSLNEAPTREDVLELAPAVVSSDFERAQAARIEAIADAVDQAAAGTFWLATQTLFDSEEDMDWRIVALVDVPASDEANRVALATITVGAR